jgi:N-acetyl-1-D-myo-inositol-2-amino-2-deoxy-alpha-D-glucopyranoside deacetylase
MKKVVAVFAHPDDEALGPAGTLATLSQDHEVYLICVTNGEAAGKTDDEKLEIGEMRRGEVTRSAKILGIKEVFFLGYKDGTLCNEIYHTLAQDIKKKIEELRPEILLTFEIRGVSGHIDHITVAMVTSFLFRKCSFVKKLMYYVTTRYESDKMGNYFVYFPDGYTRRQVDEVINISPVWEKKVAAMHCHISQVGDVERVLKNKKGRPKEEFFLVRKK